MPPPRADSPPTTNLSDLILSANDNLLADSSVSFPSPSSTSHRLNDTRLDEDDDDTFTFDQPSAASKSGLSSSSLEGCQGGSGGGGSQASVGVVFGGSMGVFESDPMKATSTSGGLNDAGLPGLGSSSTMGTRQAALDRQRHRQRGQSSNEDGTYSGVEGEDSEQASDTELSDQALQAMGMTESEIKRVHQLRVERDGLRDMNAMLGDMVRTVKNVEVKLKTFSQNTTTTHDLLDLYSRLSSQAEHTQNLLLDPQYQGASADAAYFAAREAEALRVQQEEEERLQRLAREREEARVMREQQAAAGTAGVGRGSTRGVSRGASTRGLRGVRSVSSGLSGRNVSSSTTNASTISTTTSTGIGRGRPGASGTVTGVRGVRGLRSRVGVVGGRGATGRGSSG